MKIWVVCSREKNKDGDWIHRLFSSKKKAEDWISKQSPTFKYVKYALELDEGDENPSTEQCEGE